MFCHGILFERSVYILLLQISYWNLLKPFNWETKRTKQKYDVKNTLKKIRLIF